MAVRLDRAAAVPLPFGWTWSAVLTFTWPTALALVPVAVLLGWDRYRSLGHALTDRYLVARNGSITRVTVALQRTGIIGWHLTQTFPAPLRTAHALGDHRGRRWHLPRGRH